MALHVDRDVPGAELLKQPGQAIRVRCLPERLDPGERDQTIDTTRQGFGRQDTGSFGDAFLHQGDQPTEVAISLPTLDEKGQAPSSGERQFSANEWTDTRLLRSLEKARSARQGVPIHERQSRIVQLRGSVDKVLR